MFLYDLSYDLVNRGSQRSEIGLLWKTGRWKDREQNLQTLVWFQTFFQLPGFFCQNPFWPLKKHFPDFFCFWKALGTLIYCCHSKAICFHDNLLCAQPAVDAHIAEASGNQGNQAGSSAPSMTTTSGRHDNPDSLETNNQSQSGKQVCIPWQPQHWVFTLTANIIGSKCHSHNAYIKQDMIIDTCLLITSEHAIIPSTTYMQV